MTNQVGLAVVQGAKFPDQSAAEAEQHLGDGSPSENALTTTKKKKSLDGKVLAYDEILKIVKTVETLKQDDVKARLSALPEDDGFLAFEQGGLLKRVLENNWFQEWGFGDFKDYVEKTFDFKKRKAYYLISLYTSVLDAGLTAQQVKAIGWTKLRYLLNPEAPLLTAENVEEWVEKCKTLSKDELAASIASQKQLTGPSDPGASQKDMKFKFKGDQIQTISEAIQKAKEQSGTEVDSAALEYVCLDFLGKPLPESGQAEAASTPAMSGGGDLKQAMAAVGWEKVLELFEEIWPTIGLTVEPPG